MLYDYAITGLLAIFHRNVCLVKSHSVEHAMICKRGGFIVQRHDELRNLEAELLSSVCSDLEIEPLLQQISNEQLSKGANKAADARLDIHARGFWQKQQSSFLTSGFVSLTQIRTKIQNFPSSTSYMRMKRNANIIKESTKQNKEHLLPLSSQLSE